MKNGRVSLVVALMFVFALVAAPVYATSPDDILSGHIKEADGTTGQDTNNGSGIKTDHIQDGAVTDAKIAGPISSSKIQSTGLDADTVDGLHASDLAPAVHTHNQSDVNGLDAALAGKADVAHGHDASDIVSGVLGPDQVATYAGVKVVHKGPADGVDTFNTINDAMGAITGNSATNRFAIVLMPGVYQEPITYYGKQYVDIIGQDRAGSIIEDPDGAGTGTVVYLLSNMYLKNLTVRVNEGVGVGLNQSDSGVLDCNIEISGSAYATKGISIAGVGAIQNVKITGTGTGANGIVVNTGAADAGNVLMSNIDIRGTLNYGILVWTGFDPAQRLRISDTSVIGHMGMGIYLDYGHMDLRNVHVDVDGTAGCNYWVDALHAKSANNLRSTVTVSGSVLESCTAALRVYGELSVDNSTLIGDVMAIGSAYYHGIGDRIYVGNSKIDGDILPNTDAEIKIVSCHDGNYDVIPNGVYVYTP